MRQRFFIALLLALSIFSASAQATAQDAKPKASGANSAAKADLGELSRELENPLTILWSLTFENSLHVQRGEAVEGDHLVNTLWFQPGLPIPVGAKNDKVFILRPVFPLVTAPVLDPSSSSGINGQVTGFGDIQLLSMMGPNRKSGVVWGAGATFKFPTASDDALGSGKYQAGPAAMLFRLAKPWTTGFLFQHWWSYAGEGGRPDTNQTDVKYVIRYSLPNAWSLGMGPTVTVDWEADSQNRWTVPVGLGATKMIRLGSLPVKLILEAQYSVVKPDDFGTEWKILFRFAPVIPSPFQ